MKLQHDRLLTIAVAGSRKASQWANQHIWWAEFIERLKTPARSTETLEDYLRYPKSQQDDLKDVGGYVGGELRDGRRKAGNVTGRDLITLDLDSIPPGGTEDVLRRVEGLGCAYAVYSTRKHRESAPRLRIVLPTDRTTSADEYEPTARKMGEFVGLDLCDPSTFEASRLMFWPSCSADSVYVYRVGDKPFLSVDGILGLYENWRDISLWPHSPSEAPIHERLAVKQEDPAKKKGIVGAFCRVYGVDSAIDAYLPGVYTPADDTPHRYTYTGGSTVGGAVVYDAGAFLYSHHATDPAGGRLVNSFDLVRLHKFGDLDDDAKPDTPVSKLPSYLEMRRLAVQDPRVAALLDEERYERLKVDFEDAPASSQPTNSGAWLRMLERDPNTGMPEKSAKNVQVMLEHDPQLSGRIYLDSFADRLMVVAPLPWGGRKNQTGVFPWAQQDDAGLSVYLDRLLDIKPSKLVDAAVYDYAARHARNPVSDYLQTLTWDGTPRLDTLYVDYLGAEDSHFVHTITRKALVAAVARVMGDNVKFDTMTVVCGPQRIGKSTLFRKLGRHWFTDSIKTFEGKEAEELIEGKWIAEIAELQAFNKVDVNRIKQFLSKIDDQYRAAYGRSVKTQVRRCVFFGTTNDHEYLRDPTGNRRFWPVDAMIQEPTKSVFEDLNDDEVDQIWAEAVLRWRLGETLFLDDTMEAEADKRREPHMERDTLQGQIEMFVSHKIPEDWLRWDAQRRSMYWGGGVKDSLKLYSRDRVCALEIWRECLGEHRTMSKSDAVRINAVLDQIKGWERVALLDFGKVYGKQRGFRRKFPTEKRAPHDAHTDAGGLAAASAGREMTGKKVNIDLKKGVTT